jgi:hypothetical protein
MKKKGLWLGEKTHLKKKNGYLPGFVRSPEFRVDSAGQTVFSGPIAS